MIILQLRQIDNKKNNETRNNCEALINNFGNDRLKCILIEGYFFDISFLRAFFTRKQENPTKISDHDDLRTKSYRRPTLSVLPPTSFGKSTTANPLAGLVFRRTPHIPSTVPRARSANCGYVTLAPDRTLDLTLAGIDLPPLKSFRSLRKHPSHFRARYDNLSDLS